MSMPPYEVLSNYYQKLIWDSDYDRWTEYLLTVVKNNAPTTTGVDVGCGTGIFTRKLKRAGFKVAGVDISQSMLSVAESISRKERLNIDYIKGDMRNITLFDKVGFISVVNDGINYIKPSDLLKTFKSFNKCLVKGGLLVFDISTEYKIKNVLAGNMYGDNSSDLSYIWLSDFCNEENRLDIDISFFEKKGETYVRYDENQSQYVHLQNEVVSALESAGFELVSVTSPFGKEFTEKEERLLFIAKK